MVPKSRKHWKRYNKDHQAIRKAARLFDTVVQSTRWDDDTDQLVFVIHPWSEGFKSWASATYPGSRTDLLNG